jgi:cyanate permease
MRDRLFSHELFVVLVIATIALAFIPPLVEDWTADQEESAWMRCADALKHIEARIPQHLEAEQQPILWVAMPVVAVAVGLGGLAWWRRRRPRRPRTRFGR